MKSQRIRSLTGKTISIRTTRRHIKFLNLTSRSAKTAGSKSKSAEKRKIGITRLHLEEDAGKLTHTGDGYSLVDFNRQGTPLVEIVSEPDIRTPEEAYAYLEKLKSIIQYTGVSDCKMEEGSLRCDANISLRPIRRNSAQNGAENLNSFAFVQKDLSMKKNAKSRSFCQAESFSRRRDATMKRRKPF